jgi:hypothetical protein
MDDRNIGDEEGGRLSRSYVALGVAVVLVLVGFVLAYELHKQNAIEVCLEAGHKNCDALLDIP